MKNDGVQVCMRVCVRWFCACLLYFACLWLLCAMCDCLSCLVLRLVCALCHKRCCVCVCMCYMYYACVGDVNERVAGVLCVVFVACGG